MHLPKSWVVAGGDGRRASFLGGPYPENLRIDEIAEHGISVDNSAAYDLPHPVMAGNTYWTIDTIGNKLKGYPLQLTENKWEIGLTHDLSLPAADTFDFSGTPAFDGVCLNLLVNGQFRRVLSGQGRFEGKVLSDPIFKETQKAAPLIVSSDNPQNSYRPHRFWVIPLSSDILIVDITVLGDEDFHLIPWDNPDGMDEMRSPVMIGNRVYFITRQGRLFHLSFEGDLTHIKKSVRKLIHLSYIEDRYCSSAAALGNHLVFETMAKRPNDQYDTPYHERGVITFNCHTHQFKQDYFEPKQYRSMDEFNLYGHLPYLSDGEAVYLAQEGKEFNFNSFFPDQGLTPRKLEWKDSRSTPFFTTWDSIIIKDRLYHFDYAKRRLLTWRLPEGNEFDLHRVPGPRNSDSGYEVNLRPPIVYGRNLVLFLDRHLCFISV